MKTIELCARRLLRAVQVTACVLAFSSPCFAQEEAAEGGASEASPSGTSEFEVSEESLATAKLHFKNGVELLQEEPPNYQDAYRQFILALDMSGRSWKVLGNLGFCALKLERDGEALAFYDEYLRRGGDAIDPREKESIERETLLARGNLATVKIKSSDPSARISVRRHGSSAPVQIYQLEEGEAELGLRSGTMTIIAKVGDKRLTWEPVLGAGDEASHVFDFDAEPEGAAVAAPAEPAASSRAADPATDSGKSGGMSPLRLTGIITAGVGVLTVGGGAVLGAMSQGKASDAEDACIDGVCQESTEGDFDSASSMATTANILFIAGGVLAAGGITMAILGGNKPASESARAPSGSKKSLALSPLVAPGGGGLMAHGSF